MSPTRPKDTVEGRAYNELRNLARKRSRDLAEYITVYSLEGFLARLARIQYGGEYVLKGGLLVSAFSERRPTRDIDLAAMKHPSPDHCVGMIREIASIECDDGLSFVTDGITAEAIRMSSAYQVVRVSIESRLATAKARFHIDVNYGDPIQPEPTLTSIPLLLGGELDILAYPVSMLLAEKIVTTIERGNANTRWRDFYDILALASTYPLSGNDAMVSCETVLSHRAVTPTTVSTALFGVADLAQGKWTAWLKKQRLMESTPTDFATVIALLSKFADPIVLGEVTDMVWRPELKAWAPHLA